jgi:hypothetical protein
MNHRKEWFGYGIGCAAIALGIVACATDAFTALQIAQVQVQNSSDCSVPATKSAVFRDRGTLDLALPDGSSPPYFLPILVVNNLAAAGGSAAEEMNNIELQHFTVQLSAPGIGWGANCPSSTFDTDPITDLIPPGGSVGEGLEIIKASHSQCLRPSVPLSGLAVTATITAVGRHGGTSIVSAPFKFTVYLCLGCLQTGYTDAALQSYEYPADTPMCAAFAGSTNPNTGDPCLPPGQDKTILCCGVTETVGGVVQDVAKCPGYFPPAPTTSTATSTDTSTSTATSTTTSTSTGP